MILGGSNDKKLTDIDTHNCYICKVPLLLLFPLPIHLIRYVRYVPWLFLH